jgi:acid stress-induced BolA-like protein IbaG/YrbA
MKNLCFGPKCTILGYQTCEGSILLHWNKMMFGSVSEHFANLRQVKRCKTYVSGLNALFHGTNVAKHPFYSIGTRTMFGSVSEHFANLRHVNRCKTCVSGLNALFWGTKLAKDPFYSIGTKMMFGSVSEHFANLRHVKRCKTCVRTWMHYFGAPKLRSIHSTPLEPERCLGVFQSISLTFGM